VGGVIVGTGSGIAAAAAVVAVDLVAVSSVVVVVDVLTGRPLSFVFVVRVVFVVVAPFGFGIAELVAG